MSLLTENETLLKPGETAEMIRVSRPTLAQIPTSKLPRIRVAGKAMRFRLSDVQNFLQVNTQN